MNTGLILLIVGLFYFSAHGLSFLFKKTRVPDVLILVFAGVLIGPVLNITEVQDFGRMGPVLTIVALAVILFESGTNLKLASLGKSFGSTASITLVTSFFTILVIAIGSLPLLNGNWGLALLTGAMLSGTSSAVVIPMCQSLRVGERSSTIMVMESALTDVTCIVITFALIESMAQGAISVFGVTGQVVKSLGLASLLGILAGLFWLKIWNHIRKIPNSIFTTIAFAFVIYGVAEAIGVSGAIANLAFGITLANIPAIFSSANFPKITDLESQFFQEIVFLLKTFFFVFLGVSIRISNPAIVGFAIVMLVAIYVLRLWITRLTLPTEEISLNDAVITSIMVPKGLAPAVLVSLVIQRDIDQAETIQAIVYSIIILSIIFTSTLIPLAQTGRIGLLYQKVLSPFAPKSDKNN